VRPRHDPRAVAYHARLGGDDQLAASALVDAAAVASARFDQPEALRLLEGSLELGDSLPGRLLRARVLIMLSEYERALQDVDAAVDQGGGARALELGAWAAHYQRDFATAARLADEGAALAIDPAERAGCLTIGGWVRQCVGDLPGAQERLDAAYEHSTGSWRAVSGLWLGGLLVHRGRAQEGVDLIRPATIDPAFAAQGHPIAHAYLFAALGLGQLGRAEEALSALQQLDVATARTGTAHWAGRSKNTRGWILRNLGQFEAADESNLAALEEATAAGMTEPLSHAHLDLAAGALLAGQIDQAARRVDAYLALGERHALSWRHRMRAHLYRAEIALAFGDNESAMKVAADVGKEAAAMGASRHATLAELVEARARLASGEPIVLDRIARAVDRLGQLAGLEAWWLTAAMAAAAGVDAWMTLAESRVADLASRSGPYADRLCREAGTRLDRMRTTRRRG
jgi:tetratricopeptide (TPR) repeat protein